MGLKPTEAERLLAYEEKLQEDKRSNEDRIEELKNQIRTVEARAKGLKKKYDNAHGGERRILAREIELAVRELDQTRHKEQRIVGNLEKITLALARIAELNVGAVDSEVFDELTDRLSDEYAELKDTDKAARDLENTEYSGSSGEPDVEKAIGKLESKPELSDGALKLFADLGLDAPEPRPKERKKREKTGEED